MIFIKETVNILDENFYECVHETINVLFLIEFGKTEHIIEIISNPTFNFCKFRE